MQPYVPQELPLKNLDYRCLVSLVGEANAHLGRYDGLLKGIVNPSVMLSPLTNEEAVLSSKIEGTQATIDEVLKQEAGIGVKYGEKYEDIQEIINYRKALRSGEQYLAEYTINLPFVRELHKILLTSVRGQTKTPGEFRKDQNWIGRPGCSMEEATFVPPNPMQLPACLDAWQKYLMDDDIDPLLQTSIMHAQFELIHPFKDGNGRIGRILIPLYLYQKKILSQPMFYLSAYLEGHREEYYQRLENISLQGGWDSWIVFFLKAMIQQAQANIHKVNNVIALYDEMKKRISDLTHSQYAMRLMDAIFKRPIFRASDFADETGIHKTTAAGLLRQLKEAKILIELQAGKGRRASVLCFSDLLNIAEGKIIV